MDAERGGAKAVVLTVDVPVTGQRERDLRQKTSAKSNLQK